VVLQNVATFCKPTSALHFLREGGPGKWSFFLGLLWLAQQDVFFLFFRVGGSAPPVRVSPPNDEKVMSNAKIVIHYFSI